MKTNRVVTWLLQLRKSFDYSISSMPSISTTTRILSGKTISRGLEHQTTRVDGMSFVV